MAGGVAAVGLGLAGLVKSLKDAHKPNDPAAPSAPTPARPGMEIPSGIWAAPEAPTSTGNEWVDHYLGYSGGIKPRKRGLL